MSKPAGAAGSSPGNCAEGRPGDGPQSERQPPSQPVGHRGDTRRRVVGFGRVFSEAEPDKVVEAVPGLPERVGAGELDELALDQHVDELLRHGKRYP